MRKLRRLTATGLQSWLIPKAAQISGSLSSEISCFVDGSLFVLLFIITPVETALSSRKLLSHIISSLNGFYSNSIQIKPILAGYC